MRGRGSLAAGVALLCLALVLPALAHAAEQRLVIDPGSAKVSFKLKSSYHDVVGTLPLTTGTIRFDAATGSASGRIVMDARGADTGNSYRDGKMHGQVLESEKFPRIVFRPTHLEVLHRDAKSADVKLQGDLEMHGATHPVTIPGHLEAHGDKIAITASFPVRYVDWGMKNVSNFFLHVGDGVVVTVSAEGTLEGR